MTIKQMVKRLNRSYWYVAVRVKAIFPDMLRMPKNKNFSDKVYEAVKNQDNFKSIDGKGYKYIGKTIQ